MTRNFAFGQGDIKAGRCALISGATGTVIALSQKRSIEFYSILVR